MDIKVIRKASTTTLSAYELDILTIVLMEVIGNLTLGEDGAYHENHEDWRLSLTTHPYTALKEATRQGLLLPAGRKAAHGTANIPCQS
jgi:hypothetical protein